MGRVLLGFRGAFPISDSNSILRPNSLPPLWAPRDILSFFAWAPLSGLLLLETQTVVMVFRQQSLPARGHREPRVIQTKKTRRWWEKLKCSIAEPSPLIQKAWTLPISGTFSPTWHVQHSSNTSLVNLLLNPWHVHWLKILVWSPQRALLRLSFFSNKLSFLPLPTLSV